MKSKIAQFIPPIILDLKNALLAKKRHQNFEGNFSSWAESQNNSTGYSAENILKNCRESLIKVKSSEFLFERDSVLFNTPQYSWPLLVSLQHVALANKGTLNVIDFGGSLGSTYFNVKKFINNLKSISWTIVEQKNFVDCGKEEFSSSELAFEYNIEDAVSKKGNQCLLLSGVLQYLENPLSFVDSLIEKNFEYIIIDRTSFINDQMRLTVQNVSENIYAASYPAWFFNEVEFLMHFNKQYDILYDFKSAFDGEEQSSDKKKLYWKGYLLKRKHD